MVTIFVLAIIQSLYDFAGWFGLFKENDKHPKRLYFRITKEVLDFAVVPVIAFYYFGVPLQVFAAFYIAKWLHLCDSFYNIWRYILTNQPTPEWGYWRWWTPLGLLRTNFWGFCVFKGYTEYDYDTGDGFWHPHENLSNLNDFKYYKSGFSRGMVSAEEAYIQTLYGLILASIILAF
ncbi:MAG: hypothetical protein IAE90_04475 [Ignavibacteria bacterium]|nr:hypothetical protein [Ignavibacteria bacterium]